VDGKGTLNSGFGERQREGTNRKTKNYGCNPQDFGKRGGGGVCDQVKEKKKKLQHFRP